MWCRVVDGGRNNVIVALQRIHHSTLRTCVQSRRANTHQRRSQCCLWYVISNYSLSFLKIIIILKKFKIKMIEINSVVWSGDGRCSIRAKTCFSSIGTSTSALSCHPPSITFRVCFLNRIVCVVNKTKFWFWIDRWWHRRPCNWSPLQLMLCAVF